MPNFENQLQSIAYKSELHALIDSLGDDAKVLLIMQSSADEDYNAELHYKHLGDINMGECLWLLEKCKQWLLSDPEGEEEDDEE